MIELQQVKKLAFYFQSLIELYEIPIMRKYYYPTLNKFDRNYKYFVKILKICEKHGIDYRNYLLAQFEMNTYVFKKYKNYKVIYPKVLSCEEKGLKKYEDWKTEINLKKLNIKKSSLLNQYKNDIENANYLVKMYSKNKFIVKREDCLLELTKLHLLPLIYYIVDQNFTRDYWKQLPKFLQSNIRTLWNNKFKYGKQNLKELDLYFNNLIGGIYNV